MALDLPTTLQAIIDDELVEEVIVICHGRTHSIPSLEGPKSVHTMRTVL